MITKYTTLAPKQIASIKSSIRKSIFFLLLYLDPKTQDQFPDVNVDMAFEHIQDRLGGLNDIMLQPPELIMVMTLLEAARRLYNSEDFSFERYRKLILDAGSEIMSLKEGGSDD